MWKKSGAWFFKGIPKYELPRRDTNISKSFRREEKPIVPRTMKLGVRLNDSSSSEEDTDKVDSTLLQRRQSSLHMGNGSTTRERTHTVSSEATLGSRKMSFGQHSQTLSSTNSQDSATFSLAEWRSQQEGGGLIRTSSILRRGSISSSYSVSESSTGVLSATTISQGCKEPPLGWVELVLNYDESNHSLDCSVIRARDLPPMDSAGLADPFCKINVVSIDGMARQQRNDFLGSLMLGPTSKGRRLKQWRDCVRLPDHCHEQWHCLSADPPH
uniref:Putative ca2+-dependent phospholipid-binding protein synaptotagmin n=1 Tax=Lutzomyia longipalpis TaxID=7200 RepID=A0A1B0C8V3_LUTLO